MAAGITPKPGSEYGPCKQPCKHIDCAESRAIAAGACRHCSKRIGYGVRYYRDEPYDPAGERHYVHAACAEDVNEYAKSGIRDASEVSHD